MPDYTYLDSLSFSLHVKQKQEISSLFASNIASATNSSQVGKRDAYSACDDETKSTLTACKEYGRTISHSQFPLYAGRVCRKQCCWVDPHES